MKVRELSLPDYDTVYSLWVECGLKLGKSDSKEEIEKFIAINPKTSLVGVLDGKIMACVLGGFDGRRGLVHHLCVHPDFQERGYGSTILRQLETEFREQGIVKMSFWVLQSNVDVVSFYEKLGYELRNDIITMSKELD